MIEEYVRKQLMELSDLEYKNFHKKLIPTVNEKYIIGIRTPVLRKFAKDFVKNGNYGEFIKILPHVYYEENNLHAFILEEIKDIKKLFLEIECFLPFIDNWATCDMFFPKIFKKYPDMLYEKIQYWIKSTDIYTVRFAIVNLIRCLDYSCYEPFMLELVKNASSKYYYINMAIAWYFSIALIKHYDDSIVYFTENKLPLWIHNKALQKACESFRFSKEQKAYFKSLKK